MIHEKFQPLFTKMNNRELQIRNEIEIKVKKELGIYDLYVRHDQLKLELNEIKNQLKKWEETNYNPDTQRRESPIDSMVRERMDQIQNGYKQKLLKARDDLIYSVKLSGVDEKIKETFERLPQLITDLSKEANKLPSVNKTIKLITQSQI
jgi:hypothetical protein